MTREPLQGLPAFSVDDYDRLLAALIQTGRTLRPVSQIALDDPGASVYLRHDVDLHLPGIQRMAEVEAARGARSTWLVLLTQHYNPMHPDNRAILRHLAGLGHEIGLHYDLTTYPLHDAEAREHLDWEVSVVSRIAGVPVRCISMHQPYEGRDDVFRSGSGYIHPHDPAYGADLRYVSDSCRAWRDESLLECLRPDGPRRLLLLTHPELWLDGSVRDRITYLETVLRPNVAAQQIDFVDRTVRGVWGRHPGPPLHDAREAAAAARG